MGLAAAEGETAGVEIEGADAGSSVDAVAGEFGDDKGVGSVVSDLGLSGVDALSGDGAVAPRFAVGGDGGMSSPLEGALDAGTLGSVTIDFGLSADGPGGLAA